MSILFTIFLSLVLLLLTVVLYNLIRVQSKENVLEPYILPIGIGISLLLIIFSFVFPYILTGFGFSDTDGLKETGEIGDTIGGLMNPIIAIAGVIVTGLAFYAQYRANQEFKNSTSLQLFDTQFYNMLELYKSSVAQLKIDENIKGKDCFENWFREIKVLSIIADETFISNKSLNKIENQSKTMERVMEFFFYGKAGHQNSLINSKEQVDLDMLNFEYPDRLEIYENTVNNLDKIPKHEDLDKKRASAIRDDLYWDKGQKNVISMFPSEESVIPLANPFVSKISQLSSYYRILSLITYFVIDSEVISESQKKIYIKILRSQLTPYEQLLIYFNVFTHSGKSWIDRGAIIVYKIIKNMHVELIDFGIRPFEYFDFLKKNRFPNIEVRESDEGKVINDQFGKAIFDLYSN